ncbi:MAG TPA: TolC family protein [Gemmatimonadales bacterium]
MNRTTVLIAALALVPVPVVAQRGGLPSVPQKLSLADAVTLANQGNPGYLQTLNNRPPAAWGVRNAFASLLPSVSVNGGIQYSGPGSQTFLSSTFSQPSGTISSSYGVSLNWNFSGTTLMLPSLRKAQLEATDAQISGSQINLRTQVEGQYLAVLQAQEGVTEQQAVVKQTEEALRLAQARYDVGQGTLVDVRSAQVNKGRADVALLQAQQAVTVQKLSLFQVIGVAAPDDPSVVTLSDTFPVVAPHWTLQQLLSDADAQNPDLNSLKAQETSAKWNARAAASNWLPNFNVSAGWSGYTQQYTSPQFLVDQAQTQAAARVQGCEAQNTIAGKANAAVGDSILPLTVCSALAYDPTQGAAILAQNSVFPFNFTKSPFSLRLGVSVPVPFFDHFNQNLSVSQAQAQSDDARLAVAARELDVRRAVSQAYYALVTAYQTIGIQDTNRTAANEQLRLATERYRVGSGTFLELLQGQASQQQAEHDYANSVYQYHGAVATLEAAVGRSLR